MDPITVGMSLLRFAPSIAGFFGGDDAEDKAKKVTDMALSITGKKTPEEAAKALEADKDLATRLDKAAKEYSLAIQREETKRIESVNRTMQTEAKSDHWMQWSWRPANGYLFGITLFGSYFLLPLAGKDPVALPEPVLMSWAAVLGITAWTRGTEKANKARVDATSTPLVSVLKNSLNRQKR